MNGGSSAPYLARTPCVPSFCTLFNRGGNRRAFRLPGACGDHFHCMVEPSSGHIRCRILRFWKLPCPSFPCFFRKRQGKPAKKQGIFIPTEPLKSLEKKRKTLQKYKEFLAREKHKEFKKGKERKDRVFQDCFGHFFWIGPHCREAPRDFLEAPVRRGQGCSTRAENK